MLPMPNGAWQIKAGPAHRPRAMPAGWLLTDHLSDGMALHGDGDVACERGRKVKARDPRLNSSHTQGERSRALMSDIFDLHPPAICAKSSHFWQPAVSQSVSDSLHEHEMTGAVPKSVLHKVSGILAGLFEDLEAHLRAADRCLFRGGTEASKYIYLPALGLHLQALFASSPETKANEGPRRINCG